MPRRRDYSFVFGIGRLKHGLIMLKIIASKVYSEQHKGERKVNYGQHGRLP
jgi:hypothetical protein